MYFPIGLTSSLTHLYETPLSLSEHRQRLCSNYVRTIFIFSRYSAYHCFNPFHRSFHLSGLEVEVWQVLKARTSTAEIFRIMSFLIDL